MISERFLEICIVVLAICMATTAIVSLTNKEDTVTIYHETNAEIVTEFEEAQERYLEAREALRLAAEQSEQVTRAYAELAELGYETLVPESSDSRYPAPREPNALAQWHRDRARAERTWDCVSCTFDQEVN